MEIFLLWKKKSAQILVFNPLIANCGQIHQIEVEANFDEFQLFHNIWKTNIPWKFLLDIVLYEES